MDTIKKLILAMLMISNVASALCSEREEDPYPKVWNVSLEKKILKSANAGDEIAQTVIVKRFYRGQEFNHAFATGLKKNKYLYWSILKLAETDDIYAVFALRFLDDDTIARKCPGVFNNTAARAKAGHRLAISNYAYMLLEGKGVPQNRDEGHALLTDAANQGCPFALNNLGVAHWSDASSGENKRKALSCWLRAAETGWARAQFNCALALESINPLPNSAEFAAILGWYKKAADQHMTEAQYQFGFRLARYLENAPQNSVVPAEILTAIGYANGDSIADCYQLSLVYLKDAGDQGHVKSQELLGRAYRAGLCRIPKDDSEAFKWYDLAAKQGGSESQFQSGIYYAKPTWPSYNVEEAFKLFMCAAKKHHEQAMVKLEKCYASGTGVAVNLAEAARWAILSQSNIARYFRYNKSAERASSYEKTEINPLKLFWWEFLEAMKYGSDRTGQRTLNSFCFYSDQLGIYEDRGLIIDDAFSDLFKEPSLAIRAYTFRLSSLWNYARNYPVLCTSFAIASECMSYIDQQQEPPFIHVYEFGGNSYLTLGKAHVQKIKGIEEVLDYKGAPEKDDSGRWASKNLLGMYWDPTGAPIFYVPEVYKGNEYEERRLVAEYLAYEMIGKLITKLNRRDLLDLELPNKPQLRLNEIKTAGDVIYSLVFMLDCYRTAESYIEKKAMNCRYFSTNLRNRLIKKIRDEKCKDYHGPMGYYGAPKFEQEWHDVLHRASGFLYLFSELDVSEANKKRLEVFFLARESLRTTAGIYRRLLTNLVESLDRVKDQIQDSCVRNELCINDPVYKYVAEALGLPNLSNH